MSCVTLETNASQTLSIRRKNLQLAEDRRKAEDTRNKQREMHDLLTFVQGQIHGEMNANFWQIRALSSKGSGLSCT